MYCQEMSKDMSKHFNSEDNFCANQHLIGYKDLFRGLIAKDCVIDNFNSRNVHPHDVVLIENCVTYCHDCWKRR